MEAATPIEPEAVIGELSSQLATLREAAHAVLIDTAYSPGDKRGSARVSLMALAKLADAARVGGCGDKAL